MRVKRASLEIAKLQKARDRRMAEKTKAALQVVDAVVIKKLCDGVVRNDVSLMEASKEAEMAEEALFEWVAKEVECRI